MPTLASSNRSQLGYKLEGIYPNFFGDPRPGNGSNLNMLSETLDFTVKNESSKTIRSDRQTSDIVQVGASASGGFAFEAQYREYDPFIQAVVQNDFTEYGTSGLSANLPALTFAAGTITAGSATAGVDSWATLAPGQWFGFIPVPSSSQVIKDYFAARAFQVSKTVAPTTTVITLEAITPINTTLVGTTMLTGAKIGSSRAYNASTMKSYTLEVGHADINQFRQYKGMVCSKMEVKLSVGSIVTGMFDFMGQGFSLRGTTGNGTPNVSQVFTPANATRGVFDIFENGASISATTYIKSGEFTIDNNLRMQDAVGVFGAAGIGAGTFKAMGKLEVYFADSIMYQKLLSGVATSLTIPLLDVEGNGYVYHFPRIKYTAAKVQVGGQDQDAMLSVDWEAVVDPVTASPTVGKTVAIYRVGALYSGTLITVLDTRPRYGVALPGAYSNPATLLAGLSSFVTGSVNDGKAGTFTVAPGVGNYGWVAVVAGPSVSGVRFFDGVGYGGWSGAGFTGNNTGASPDPTLSPPGAGVTPTGAVVPTYTDGNSTIWRFFRQDYSNAGGSFTIS
jgi:hypothetical protein